MEKHDQESRQRGRSGSRLSSSSRRCSNPSGFGVGSSIQSRLVTEAGEASGSTQQLGQGVCQVSCERASSP
jgi:hypothetical protein